MELVIEKDCLICLQRKSSKKEKWDLLCDSQGDRHIWLFTHEVSRALHLRANQKKSYLGLWLQSKSRGDRE